MAGTVPQFTELCSNLIHSDNKHNYNLRIIEYHNKDNEVVRKFGISEFWFCDGQHRWFPSAKHHVFLPLSVWPKLVGLSHVINDFNLRESNENDGPAHANSSTSHAPAAGQQPGSRRRGRPPKCVDGHGHSVDVSKTVNMEGGKCADGHGNSVDLTKTVRFEAGTSLSNADFGTEWLREVSTRRLVQEIDSDGEGASQAKKPRTEEDNAAAGERDGSGSGDQRAFDTEQCTNL